MNFCNKYAYLQCVSKRFVSVYGLSCYDERNNIENIKKIYMRPLGIHPWTNEQGTSDPDVLNSKQSSCSCADRSFLCPPAYHIVTDALTQQIVQRTFKNCKTPGKRTF